MKYITYLLLALLIPVAASALVDTQVQRYDPTPAQPGDLLAVQLALTNNQDTRTSDVQLEILESQTIRPEGRNTLQAGTIGARSSYQGTLQVRVAADAPPGAATLRYRVREGTGPWQEQTATIDLQPSQAGIIISDVQITPQTTTPGESASIQLTIQNNANSLLREVNTQLQLADTPLAPQQGATRKRAGNLAVGEQATITYELAAQPDATAGIYRVPVTLSFQDRNGNTREQEDLIGLTIDTQQRVSANVENVERTDQGAQITVRVVNKGLSEIKFLEAQASENDGYTIREQERTSYLGNIQSDDWQTMRFEIQTSQQEVSIPLSYTYQDAFNQQHQQEQTLNATLPASEQGGIGAGTIVVVLLLIGGGYWAYRRRKK